MSFPNAQTFFSSFSWKCKDIFDNQILTYYHHGPIVTWGFQESTICLNTVEVHLLRNFIGKTERVENEVKEKQGEKPTYMFDNKSFPRFFFKKSYFMPLDGMMLVGNWWS